MSDLYLLWAGQIFACVSLPIISKNLLFYCPESFWAFNFSAVIETNCSEWDFWFHRHLWALLQQRSSTTQYVLLAGYIFACVGMLTISNIHDSRRWVGPGVLSLDPHLYWHFLKFFGKTSRCSQICYKISWNFWPLLNFP